MYYNIDSPLQFINGLSSRRVADSSLISRKDKNLKITTIIKTSKINHQKSTVSEIRLIFCFCVGT